MNILLGLYFTFDPYLPILCPNSYPYSSLSPCMKKIHSKNISTQFADGNLSTELKLLFNRVCSTNFSKTQKTANDSDIL